MRYGLRDLPALVRTPLGRQQLFKHARHRAWPVYFRLAKTHRRTLAGRTRLIAVVGSYGKSTTKAVVAHGLGGPLVTGGRGNGWTAVARSILKIRPRHRFSVIEVGIDGPGQMDGFARLLRPDVAVVTSIGSEHHRSLGTMERTREEKSAMVRALPEKGTAVLNGDDPHVCWMRKHTRAPVITYGFASGLDVRAGKVSIDWPKGTRFTLFVDGENYDVRIPLLGRKMVYPVLAAASVALVEGQGLDHLLSALDTLTPLPGRMETVRLDNGAYLIRDEYKSSLETIDAALDVLANLPARRRIVVLGEVSEPPGSQGPIYRSLGRRLSSVATRAIFVGRNFQRYAAGAATGGLERSALIDAGTDLSRAVKAVLEDLEAEDVVLLKGRDTQRLDRIALALTGRTVKCGIEHCTAMLTRCDECPMLERGWDGLRVVM